MNNYHIELVEADIEVKGVQRVISIMNNGSGYQCPYCSENFSSTGGIQHHMKQKTCFTNGKYTTCQVIWSNN
jgi:hypothetical protein